MPVTTNVPVMAGAFGGSARGIAVGPRGGFAFSGPRGGRAFFGPRGRHGLYRSWGGLCNRHYGGNYFARNDHHGDHDHDHHFHHGHRIFVGYGFYDATMPVTTMMATTAADAVGCIAMPLRPAVHIGGTSITIVSDTSDDGRRRRRLPHLSTDWLNTNRIAIRKGCQNGDHRLTRPRACGRSGQV